MSAAGDVGGDLEATRALLLANGATVGLPLHLLAETVSTNDDAKDGARRGLPHGSTWVAERQTRGRGRQGRSWLSEPGENLLFSVLVRPSCPVAELPPLTIAAGLAVRDAIAKATGNGDVKVKWPNDVVVGPERKKLAGILVEAITQGGALQGVVVGIGINVHGANFPDEIRDRATSVATLGPSTIHRGALLADVLLRLGSDVTNVATHGASIIQTRFAACDALFEEPVTSDLGSGRARGIDGLGRLIVEGDDGRHSAWMAGEVHLAKTPPR